ncbi:MAG: hypothetical protein ABI700_26975 [Chloroflexota bacterium]
MRRWKLIGIVIVVVVVAIVGIALELIGSRASVVSTVSVSNTPCTDPCLRFPTITGENLPGQTFNLPADFQGKSILVIVPFDEDQQVQAQTWLAPAREIALQHPNFSYYNVPVFPSMAAPLRAIVRGGMSVSISDSYLRSLTITVFLDQRDQFLAALKLPDADTLQIFLLNVSGEVQWRGAGEYSDPQGKSLRALLQS